LSMYASEIEVYGIDEAFLKLTGFGSFDFHQYGKTIKKHV